MRNDNGNEEKMNKKQFANKHNVQSEIDICSILCSGVDNCTLFSLSS